MTGLGLFMLALTNYAVYYIYRTSPVFRGLRKLVASKISEKLVSCSFCIGFWLSPISILMHTSFSILDWPILNILVTMLYCATSNFIIYNFLEGEK